ncbi:MAG TPA: ABC transporter ATP-binding protein [Clostridiaceae bacterium]|nr:ABC transporter ATP-binding protein [Clostridiaceae bacterium]
MQKLIIENLSKSFGEKLVLNGISRTFERGKIYGIIGRNGAGKTTFFNCINRDLPIDAGKVVLADEQNTRRQMAFQDVGFVSASPSLPDFLSGFEFIKFYVRFDQDIKVNSMTDADIHAYFDLIQFDYDDRFQLIKHYSYGMKNKIQLLCCLVRKPGLLLLDEPLSSFDIIVSHEIKQLLYQIKDEHIILMSTHLLQLATDICDVILLLKDGKLMDATWSRHDKESFEQYIMRELANS